MTEPAMAPQFDPLAYPGARKVAVVITALGTEAGARVLAQFSPGEVEAIIREVKDLNRVPAGEVTGLLGQLRSEAAAQSHLLAGGVERAREILRKSHGPDADAILEQIMAAAANEPFQFLRSRRPEQVASYLNGEHPQMIAVVLAHLPLTLAAKVLESLDATLRSEVAERFAALDTIEPTVVKDIDAALERRAGHGPVEQTSTRGGVKTLAQLLNSVGRETEKGVLADLEKVDAELAGQVRDLMFVFEDLVHLDDRSMQEVLREAGSRPVALALKDANGQIRDKFEKNLSQRAAEDIKEITDALGPVRRSEIEAAQQDIVKAARKLEEAGRIMLVRGDAGEFVS
jgi:flagellar motor switch protein FliG